MGRRLLAAAGLVLLVALCGWLLFWLVFDDRTASGGLAAAVDAGAQERLGERIRVLEVEGSVDRQRGNEGWTQVKVGDELAQEEAIRTQGDGRAVLGVGKSTRVEVAPRSMFSVRAMHEKVAKGLLSAGRISATVGNDDGTRLRVESGSGAVAEGERAAEFSVLASGNGEVSVAAKRGEVRLTSKNETVQVPPGQQSIALPNLPPSKPQPIPSSLFLKVGRPNALVQRELETTISGTTTPGALISINGMRLAADQAGSFKVVVPLAEGKNAIHVEAEDAAGRREAVKLPDEITVKRQVGAVKSKVSWSQDGPP